MCIVVRYFLLLMIGTTVGCASGQQEQIPFLADQFRPSATPAATPSARTTAVPTPGIVANGDLRTHRVVAPNGRLYALRWYDISESKGRPQDGWLSDGSRLPRRGVGYRHIGKHPYGTDECVVYLQFAAWAVNAMFPGTAPVVIGDLSRDGGGYLPPHRSHQSGRDADVGLYRSNNIPVRGFKQLIGSDLDLDKTWTFIEALIRTGRVKYIFLDRTLQERLHSYALNYGGWPAESLYRLFQYPHGNRRAIIRHARSHKNHLHVRFRCSGDDSGCKG